MMGYYYNNMMGLGGGFGWIFMLFFWVIIIAGIILAIQWLIKESKPKESPNTALNILKERYAKGEIGKKEFDQKYKDLAKK